METARQPSVSVIIPFFNSSETLLRCLKSVENQTLQDIEIVLVDDGSTDGSLQIAKNYASGCKKTCRVFHQENGGPSSARNLGLLNSTGRYIAFVDSDDTIDATMLEKMVASGDKYNSDIVSCGRLYLDASSGVELRSHVPKYDVLDGNAFSNPSIVKRVGPLMCDKIIRRQLIEGHGIRLDTNFSHAEDFLFLSRCKLYTSCVSAVGEPLYHYYIGNPDSISGANSTIIDIPQACLKVIHLYQENGIFESTRQQLLYVLLGYYLRKCSSVEMSSPILKQFKKDFILIFEKYFRDSWVKGLKKRIKKDFDASRKQEILFRSLPFWIRVRYRIAGF